MPKFKKKRGNRAMMVFWEAGLALLAVPKTGTQALAAALGERADLVIRNPPALKHMTADRFRRRLRPVLEQNSAKKLTTVAVLRDPLDWLGSWYRYRGRPGLSGRPNSTARISFDRFVLDYLSDAPPAHAAVGSQFRFVTNGNGKVIVDTLLPYEAPEALLAFLSARLGFPVSPPPQRNVSPERPLALSTETEARLRTQLEADFALHAAVRNGAHGA